MPRDILLKVNGRKVRVNVDPETPLLYVLRNDLGLRGAKFGCGLEQCGACKVVVDGRAVPSCRLPVGSVEHCAITTVEGLAAAGRLHPLQQAFLEEQAAQCGFCTPGMVMAAKALLDRNPAPTEAEIRAEMAGNLCRCGVHDRVVRAVLRASGQPVRSRPAIREPQESRTALAPTRFPAQGGEPSPSLKQAPGLDEWIRIDAGGSVTLLTGKVELGQDLRTALAMIAADELDVPLERVRVVMGDTAQTPDEGYTVSSRSLETTGNAIRQAAAEVRELALLAAAEHWSVPRERLTLRDGAVRDPASGQRASYGELFGERKFNRDLSGVGVPKGPEAYGVVGRDTQRLDMHDKVTGAFGFLQDLELPGMLHGRVVRPPHDGARLSSVDENPAVALPGVVKVVRDGSFLAVIAEREEQAVRARAALRQSATWTAAAIGADQDQMRETMLHQADRPFLVVNQVPVDDPISPVAAPAEAAKTLEAVYYRPYCSHASLGPSAAVAWMRGGKLTVWTHNQGSHPLRSALAQALGMPEAEIHVVHVDGPGCYGHNGADDAALDAALLARALPGRPVSLRWMRDDENGWEPYGTAAVIRMQASLNARGEVIDWNHDVWSYTHSTRPRDYGAASGLLAAWHLARPFPHPSPGPNRTAQGGIHRNADPLYTFPNRRIVKHFLPASPLRVSALRGLGSFANVFALESFVDELAHAAGADPVEFRLRYLADERARAVLSAAMEQAGRLPDGLGRGVGFIRYKNRQSYIAAAVDLEVDRSSGRIRLMRGVMAADSGQIVHPEGMRSQLEGAFIQAASWTLFEQVAFHREGIASLDWQSYPVARFPDLPAIETVLVNRPGRPYLGLGEGALGPVSAAIANAVFAAAGIRLRTMPFTPGRVKTALAEVS